LFVKCTYLFVNCAYLFVKCAAKARTQIHTW
jgi:hypothetical protein